MEAIVEYFSSMDVNIDNFLIAVGMLIVALFVVIGLIIRNNRRARRRRRRRRGGKYVRR